MFFRRVVVLGLALALLSGAVAFAAVSPIETHVQEQDGATVVRVRTDLVDYQFNTQGAVLQSAYIHFNTFDTQHTEMVPDVNTDQETYFRSFQFPGAMDFPFQLSLDVADSAPYDFRFEDQTDQAVTLTFTRTDGNLEIVKRYRIQNTPDYQVQFQLSLRNLGPDPLTLDQGYTLTLGQGLAQLEDAKEVYLINGKRRETLPAPPYAFGGVGYLGHGLAIFLKNETPATNANSTVMPWAGVNARSQKVLGARVESVELAAGAAQDYQYLLYAGRWKYLIMEESGLGEVAGNGPFSQLLVWTIQGLNWLYAWTGNYGWAIILFTIITRIVFFPLLRQQFHSMSKMREVQPKLLKLRERYPALGELRKTHADLSMAELQARARENREKLNRKMMELYQREGVNPLGGCLPTLLQFPFLILLWRTILYSAEAVHFSPGFMWIGDLSQPDPLYILVVLTTAVMILQTKLTPQMASGGQNQLLIYAMPLVMAVVLKDFPAGLWLYYFLTTAIQVGQQAFINWEIAQKKPAVSAFDVEPDDIDEDEGEDKDESEGTGDDQQERAG